MKVEIPTHRWSGALALPIKFDTSRPPWVAQV
jgi:hypothetical protein